MNSQTLRAIVPDDHPLVRMGIEAELSETPAIELVGSVRDSTGLMELLGTGACDVLVTDFAMPGGQHGDGFELLDHIHGELPDLAIVVITAIDKPAVIRNLSRRGVVN